MCKHLAGGFLANANKQHCCANLVTGAVFDDWLIPSARSKDFVTVSQSRHACVKEYMRILIWNINALVRVGPACYLLSFHARLMLVVRSRKYTA